jgi:arylsulfatase A-like enzyme
MRLLLQMSFLTAAQLASLAWAQEAVPAPRAARNVLVILADDAGYADFGFQRQVAPDMRGRTPNLDRLAASGACFTAAYTSGCVCSPTRAGLLTGRYQQRFGHERNLPQGYQKGGLPLTERTIADHLRERGLTTALIGKWHLGYPAAYHPNQRGFDLFHGLLMGSRPYVEKADLVSDQRLQRNGELLPEGGHVTERFGAAAVALLEERAKAKQPFFLFVAFTAPHGPLQPAAADLEVVADIARQRRRNYAGLVVGLDRAVGRILAALEEHGLSEDTLVVFTNDNGGQTQTGADNTPLRGRKGQLWEGGIRVPMLMRWPGRIAPGSRIDDPVTTLDLLPTALAAIGGGVDPKWKLDGVDLLPRVTGVVDRLAERTLFWRNDGPGGPVAARRGNLKLLIGRREPKTNDEHPGEPAQAQLFDLAADLGEAREASKEHPDAAASLQEAIGAWESQLVAPLWGQPR